MKPLLGTGKLRSIGKAALVAGALAAPLAGAAGAAAQTAPAQSAPVQTIAPLKSDVCVSGPLGFVRGCVDVGRHRWWDGGRWWNGDRAWDGDDWRHRDDGPNWRDRDRDRGRGHDNRGHDNKWQRGRH